MMLLSWSHDSNATGTDDDRTNGYCRAAARNKSPHRSRDVDRQSGDHLHCISNRRIHLDLRSSKGNSIDRDDARAGRRRAPGTSGDRVRSDRAGAGGYRYDCGATAQSARGYRTPQRRSGTKADAEMNHSAGQTKRPRLQAGPFVRSEFLPAIVRECLVGFRHFVRVVFLLDRVAFAFAGGNHFGGELLRHRLLVAIA